MSITRFFQFFSSNPTQKCIYISFLISISSSFFFNLTRFYIISYFQNFYFYSKMLSVEQASRAARGTIAKTIKSTKQATTKFTPPTHPAIIVTSAFTSPHISKLKSALEENFIAYGMQTSKKKVNRPPGFPTDKNFVIADDSLGPSILQGEFLLLKMCRVDYPRTNNLKDVIKKFDQYIGLGKETVQQNQRLEEIVEPGWQQNQTNLKMLKAGNGQGNQLQQINGVFGKKLQLNDLQKVMEVKQKVQNFKDVFKRSKKNQSFSESSNDSKNKNKKNKKQKKSKTQKKQKLQKASKASASRERQDSNIKLKSVNKMNEKGPNKYLQKRSLFMLLTNKQSGNYEKEIKKLSSGQNKRMIPIKQVSEYYKLCYENGQGENCLLLSPNVAFKELHKYRNLKDVYIYGDDPEFCSQLIKGNIKKAALDPESLEKILDQQGFNNDQPKQYIQPKRWLGSANPKSTKELESKKNRKQKQHKPTLFSRFVNFVKGKDKQKNRSESATSKSSIQPKKRKTQKKNKSSSESISSLSSLSSSSKKSSSMKSKKNKKIQLQKPKVLKQEQKLNNELQQNNTQKFDPISLGRLVNENKKNENNQTESVKQIIQKEPSRRIIKLKSKVNTKEMTKQNVNQQDEVFNLKLNSKVPSAQMQNEELKNQSILDKSIAKPNQIVFLGRGSKKQGSIIVTPPKISSDKQNRKSSLTKKLKFDPGKIDLQKNKKSSSSSLSDEIEIKNSRKKPNSESNKKKEKENQHEIISFEKSKVVTHQKFNEDYYYDKKNIILAKQHKIYRNVHGTEPDFHFQKPSDDQQESKLVYSQVVSKKKTVLVNKIINGPVNQTIDEMQYQIPQNKIKDIPVVASNLIRTTQMPLNFQENINKPMQNKFMRSLSGTPNNNPLPFDESKYDRIIQNGIVVYRPKGFSLYNNIPISPKPFVKTPTLYFNPNISPTIMNRPSQNPFFLSGIPLKQTNSTQGSQSNNCPLPEPQCVKNPSFSTYQYFKNNKLFPKEIKKRTQSDTESQVTCHKCKTPKVSKEKKRDKMKKEGHNPFQNQYCTRPSNKLTKTRQLYESLDSDESRDKYKKKVSSLDKYSKNKDPLSSILDQTSHLGLITQDKNFSVLYVVHSMFPPELIKQLFQISDSSDTIQTFSKPQKLRQIIQKGKNVFDFILVFDSNLENEAHNEVKGLYRVSYHNKCMQTTIENDIIRINRTKELKDILKGIFQNKPLKKHKPEEASKIGYVYFKDFNRAIRDLAKIIKRQYPDAQTRKYFSVMDLPTKLPSVKNQLTLILIDQISFNQITKYCQEQQIHNRNLIKICIPKSSQAMKLCKNQAGMQKMIWLTERQLEDSEFIMRRLVKRNR